MAIGFFTLQGTYLAYGDTPASGTVQIDGLPQVIVDTTGDKIKVGPKKVTLDTSGSFSIQLPTDSTTGNSTTLGYRVTARLKHANVDPIEFRAKAANATLNMADVQPQTVEPIGDTAANALRAQAAADDAVAARDAALAVGVSGLQTVVHGADPSIARPNIGTGSVRWVGSVVPNAIQDSTDIFVQTVDPLTINPLTIAPWFGAWYANTLVTAGGTDGSTVTSWTDGTAGGRALTPNGPLATGAATLKTAAPELNNRAAVKFNASPLGSPDFATSLTLPNTLVVVANSGGTGQALVGDTEGVTGGLLYRTTVPNQWKFSSGGVAPPVASTALDTNGHIFICTASNTATAGNMRIDGVDFKAATGGAFRKSVRLGLFNNATPSALLTGQIAFAAVMAGQLTTSQIALLETWARAYYGLNF